MTLSDTCDIEDCEFIPAKVVTLRGLGLFSRFNGESMELCAKHSMELLEYLWVRSKARLISNNPRVKKEKSK